MVEYLRTKNVSGVTFLLNNITVVILSRDRNYELLRTIEYYEQIGINCLVLHNSNTDLSVNHRWKYITYIRSETTYVDRASMIKNYLRTSLAILSTDDERYLPSTLNTIALELKKQHFQGSVGGQAVGVYKYGHVNCGHINYKYLQNYNNYFKSIHQRVDYHFEKSTTNITFGGMYRMYSSENFLGMMKLFSMNNRISTPYIHEVTSEIYSLAIGPIKYVNDLLWIRNWNVPPINTKDWNRKLVFFDWWKSKEFESEKLLWTKNLNNELKGFLKEGELQLLVSAIVKNRTNEFSQKPIKLLNFKIKQDIKFVIMKSIRFKSAPITMQDVVRELIASKIYFQKKELQMALSSIYKRKWNKYI